MKPLTMRELQTSNISDPVNALVETIVAYSFQFGCSIEDSMSDFSRPIDAELQQLILEASEYILSTIENRNFNDFGLPLIKEGI